MGVSKVFEDVAKIGKKHVTKNVTKDVGKDAARTGAKATSKFSRNAALGLSAAGLGFLVYQGNAQQACEQTF